MQQALQLDPIQIPLIGNSLAIGFVSLLHIAIAGLAVAFMVAAPLVEAMGATRPQYVELGHSMARFTLVTYTASVVLAVIMVEFFIGLYPRTNAWLFNTFRLPIGIALAAFLLQLLLLYPYYHYWEVLRARSIRLHVALGAGAALCILIWAAVLDGIGSYMLTPASADHPLRNATFLPLVVHRFFGNFVMAGYVLAGYGAWRLTRVKTEDEAYYGLMIRAGMSMGILALLIQPLTGFLYAQAIDKAVTEPNSTTYQALLALQYMLIAMLLLGSILWLRLTQKRPMHQAVLWTAVLPAACLIASSGYENLRRVWALLLMASLGWALYAVGTPFSSDIRSMVVDAPRWIAKGLAVCAVVSYLLMGVVRERARHPDTVHGIISMQEEMAVRP